MASMPLTTVTQAHVTLGNKRKGHGLTISFSAQHERGWLSVDEAFIDAYGDFWSALGPGVGTMAGMLLPLRLRELNKKDVDAHGRAHFTTSFTVGAFKLSHKTLLEKLEAVASGGDRLIVMEILVDAQKQNIDQGVLVRIPTKASLMLQSLKASQPINIVCAMGTQKPKNRSKSLVWRWAKWLGMMATFVALLWALTFTPDPVISASEATLPMLSWFATKTATLRSVLPPHPTSFLEAFQFGKLTEELRLDPGSSARILAEAALVAGRDAGTSLTKEQLLGVEERIIAMASEVSIIGRIWGFFSFINIMWLLAICGIAISIGPAIYLMLRPLQKLLLRICTQVLKRVIIPFCDKCHRFCIFELAAWTACWCFVVHGARMSNPDVGFYLSLTGLVLAAPAAAYSSLVHGGTRLLRSAKHIDEAVFVNSWIAVGTAPMAIFFESSLLGYATVFAIFGVLGFSFLCGGLCYYIGFRDKTSTQRVACASTLLLLLFTSLRIAGVTPRFLRPFSSAVAVAGSLTLYLALLIIASKWSRHNQTSYAVRQTVMIAALVLGLFIGFVFGMAGIANTATVFLVLFVMEKYVEFHERHKFNGWFLMLLGSVIMYRSALWLHSNPEFVASIFAAHM